MKLTLNGSGVAVEKIFEIELFDELRNRLGATIKERLGAGSSRDLSTYHEWH